MLQFLRIRNLALLDAVALEFGPGFIAVTGETGAGKSVLLGALSLLSGARADKTLIRQGADACEVEASLYFQDAGRVDARLRDLGLPECEEGMLVLRRTMPRDKAPRITVNGSLATLSNLQDLGELWIDFHGPSEPRRLLRPACQLELLDLFGRNQVTLAAFAGAFAAWRETLDERRRLTEEERLDPDQLEFHRARLARIESLDLEDESIAALERDFQRFSQAQELTELAGRLAAGLHGDDGLAERLAPLVRSARELAGLDEASRPLLERLESLTVEAGDLADDFENFAGELSFDDEQAERLQREMALWLELKRRYGGGPAEVRRVRDDIRRRIAAQADLEGTLVKLDREIASRRAEVEKLAGELRRRRQDAAGKLAREASRLIAGLGFRKSDFKIELDEPGELTPRGDGGCEFLFSPNVGEAPLPLARIASSGELARVLLALKTLLADLDSIPLLVFDEVDANVGGEIGRVVGANMAAIGRSHQVICVTHLPQVAARAGQHYVVTKDQEGKRATVAIAPIHETRSERIEELARMLGDREARSARVHAEELLRTSSEKTKAK